MHGIPRHAKNRIENGLLPPIVAAAVVMIATGGCANEQAPPGAIRERRPPQIRQLKPQGDAVVPDLKSAATVEFDEPVNVGGNFASQIIASPAYRYDVKTGFSGISIRPRGGWRKGVVYCFQLPAGIADVIGNRTTEPIDYCFSTGPPVTSTMVEGHVEDRVTGQSSQGTRVLFLALPADTTPYSALVDRQGAFSLRSLPPATYWAYGFQDRNRNLRLDRLVEPYDSVRFTVVEGISPPSLELSLVEPDSTPPVLLAALAEDSLEVRLEFDDPLTLEQPEASVVVRDSTGRELPWRLLHVGDPASLRRQITAQQAAGQPTPGQPSPAGRPPARPVPGARPPARPGIPGQKATGPRPSRTLLVVLEDPLTPGIYRVQASGVTNLRELKGGGDTTFVYPREEASPEGPRGAGR